jgi:hypothetical protein
LVKAFSRGASAQRDGGGSGFALFMQPIQSSRICRGSRHISFEHSHIPTPSLCRPPVTFSRAASAAAIRRRWLMRLSFLALQRLLPLLGEANCNRLLAVLYRMFPGTHVMHLCPHLCAGFLAVQSCVRWVSYAIFTVSVFCRPATTKFICRLGISASITT